MVQGKLSKYLQIFKSVHKWAFKSVHKWVRNIYVSFLLNVYFQACLLKQCSFSGFLFLKWATCCFMPFLFPLRSLTAPWKAIRSSIPTCSRVRGSCPASVPRAGVCRGSGLLEGAALDLCHCSAVSWHATMWVGCQFSWKTSLNWCIKEAHGRGDGCQCPGFQCLFWFSNLLVQSSEGCTFVSFAFLHIVILLEE